MNKVVVIGSGGSGKSTFSRQLSDRTGLPVYHLDALNWRPGWVATPKEEWDALMKQLVGKDTWIIDGNYGRTMDMRLAAADTIIFLDMPRHLCVYRIIKRRMMYRGKTRPDLAEMGMELQTDKPPCPVEQAKHINRSQNDLYSAISPGSPAVSGAAPRGHIQRLNDSIRNTILQKEGELQP